MGICGGMKVDRLIIVSWHHTNEDTVTRAQTFNTMISFSILALFSSVDFGSRCRFAMRCLSNPLAALSMRESSWW